MPRRLLVLECDAAHDWGAVFEGAVVGGEEVVVEQATLNEVSLAVYSDGKPIVFLRPNARRATQSAFRPDAVLLRTVFHGRHGQDSRNILYGLMSADIPAVNTLRSAYAALERPVMYGALRGIAREAAREPEKHPHGFPLIAQAYYPTAAAMVVTPDLPVVAKLGHAHAGYGKMRFLEGESEALDDFRGVMALTPDYCTIEPYIAWDFDLRIQKIGSCYRVFRRTSPRWKGNVGNAGVNEDGEVTPQFKAWIDAAAKVHGGLDICALDLLHSEETGQYTILELNDTAIGLVHRHAAEDRMIIRELMLAKMYALAQGPGIELPGVDAPTQALLRMLEEKTEQIVHLKSALENAHATRPALPPARRPARKGEEGNRRGVRRGKKEFYCSKLVAFLLILVLMGITYVLVQVANADQAIREAIVHQDQKSDL